MKNSAIKSVCTEDSAYKYRPDTDALFQLPHGSYNYSGVIDKTIRHVENIQLMDPKTWALFVNQFRSEVDDPNRAWRCEYWGKMMRGACYTYEYTQNKALYDILSETVRDMFTTQDELGRITTYSIENEFDGWDLWGRKYVLLGMQYFLDICKDAELRKQVIDVMCRHADYIMSKVGLKEDGKKLITECTRNWLGLNSSSILEPYVRLYNLTGEKKYFDYATYIVDNGGISTGNIFDLAYDAKLYPFQYPTNKAYEMMSCYEGLLEYYRVTKNERYKTSVVNFARLVLESDITLIGCSGCTHELFDYSAKRQSTTTYPGIMQETCVTVTWMKFCYQVLSITGDSVFADAIETSMYNAMLGAVNSYNSPMIKGMPFDSYSPLFMGLRARSTGGYQEMENHTEAYGCCACIGAAGTGLMALSSAMLSKDGIYMNLYIPGAVHAESPEGTPIRLCVDTFYPSSSDVKITVNGAKGDEKFIIALRIPGWCRNASVSVNGEQKNVTSSGYLTINREWEWGDVIEIHFDMKMHVVYPPLGGSDENSKYLVALQKGPVMFARDARFGEEIDSIVDIDCDENGNVNAAASRKASFPTEQEYEVSMKDGSVITVVDYQSAGKTWTSESAMTMWLPTKNFWSFDENQPIVLTNRGTGCDFILGIDPETGAVKGAKDAVKPEHWSLVKQPGGKVRILSADGRYMTAVKDDEKNVVAIVAKPYVDCSCQLWSFDKFLLNRFRLTNAKFNKCACIHYGGSNEFLLYDITKNESFNGVSFANNAVIDVKNA